MTLDLIGYQIITLLCALISLYVSFIVLGLYAHLLGFIFTGGLYRVVSQLITALRAKAKTVGTPTPDMPNLDPVQSFQRTAPGHARNRRIYARVDPDNTRDLS